MRIVIYRSVILLLLVVFGLTACNPKAGSDSSVAMVGESPVMQVYKNPQCGCCQRWIRHIEEAGIEVIETNTSDVNVIKNRHGIKPADQSCHTAVWNDGEYVFEGHVPAKYIDQFLKEPPEGAIGLSVPAMVVGSPGMESKNEFRPYDILLLNKDGSRVVYAHISEPQQQY